jgi:hypothetical protein
MALLFDHTNKDKKGRRVTVCGIVNDKKKTISIGLSTCSLLDQFSKKIGRTLSLKKATAEKPQMEIHIEDMKNAIKEFHVAIKELVGNNLELAV